MTAIIHPVTATDIDAIIDHPSQAIGLVGASGLGKTHVAYMIAAAILNVSIEKLSTHQYFKHIIPIKESIGVEQARDLTKFMKLKTTGERKIRRVVVIEHAGVVTHEAQNALLKLIEEPPVDTVIILTLASKNDVLPTVVSRLQLTNLRQPSATDLHAHLLRNGYSEEKSTYAVRMSGGLPGLAYAMLSNEETHVQVKGIEYAKALLAGDMFLRLVMVDEIVKNKQHYDVIDGLIRISQAGLRTNNGNEVLKRWTSIAAVSLQAKQHLAHNGQPKLVMTNLCAQLS